MLVNTKGIVLNAIKYSDSSLIATVLTRELGICKYMVKGAAKPKSKFPVSFFMPLSILDLVTFHKEQSNFQNIREARFSPMLLSLHSNPHKQMLVMFASEVLLKTINAFEKNELIFDWLQESLIQLENQEKVAFWVLDWLVELAGYLGFSPLNNYDQELRPCFNIEEGSFGSAYSFSLSVEDSLLVYKLLTHQAQEFTVTERKTLMFLMMKYFKSHIPGFKMPNSLEVIYTILT